MHDIFNILSPPTPQHLRAGCSADPPKGGCLNIYSVSVKESNVGEGRNLINSSPPPFFPHDESTYVSKMQGRAFSHR